MNYEAPPPKRRTIKTMAAAPGCPYQPCIKRKQNCFSDLPSYQLIQSKTKGAVQVLKFMHCYFDLKETAVELCTACCSLVSAYHEARKRNGKMDEKVLSYTTSKISLFKRSIYLI